MGRRVKDAQLDNRTARAKLAARSEPYWRLISEGCHLGYYRGARVGKWVARHRKPGAAGGYSKTTIAEADDVVDADGERVMDWGQAQEAARLWFAQIGSDGKKGGPFTIGDALDTYLADFTGKSLSATRGKAETYIRPELGALSVADVSYKELADWHRSIGASERRVRTGRGKAQAFRAVEGADAIRRRRSTANRVLTVLKAALNKAFREGRVDSDIAWRKVKPFPGVEEAKRRYLSDDEARRLVNASGEGLRPLVQAALLTGARYGELRRIKRADVDLEAGTVWLAVTKSGHARAVYLEAEGLRLFAALAAGKAAGELLFRRANGGEWNDALQRRPVQAACAAASIEPPVSFHDLRRTYGARLALQGVPMAVIAEAMGHADERITRRHYAHLAPSYVASTVRKHVAGMGIVGASNVLSMDEAKARRAG